MSRAIRAFVAVALVAAGLGACSREEQGYPVTAYFSRGISLYEGSDVRVLGLPAGTIDRVSVEGAQVKVEMTLRHDIPIPTDVRATLVPISLIGERYVQLFPAWTEGEERAPAGTVIPLERTSVPVEPDEALAALKRFLDSLDPTATGRLVTNLADDLDGNGRALHEALGGIAELTVTLADKDEELVRILHHFDDFTATLAAREEQLGRVLESFATTAAVLAEERQNIERLVRALATLSVDGLDLVAEHRLRLQHDIETLTRTLLSVQANMASVRQLLDAAPIMVAGEDLDGVNEGLNAAYDAEHHRIDLRNTTSPVLSDLFRTIGIPVLEVCVPAGVVCPPGTTPIPAVPGPGVPAGSGGPAAEAAGNPVGAVVDLLGSPTDARTTRAADLADAVAGGGSAPLEHSSGRRAPTWLSSLGRAIADVLP